MQLRRDFWGRDSGFSADCGHTIAGTHHSWGIVSGFRIYLHPDFRQLPPLRCSLGMGNDKLQQLLGEFLDLPQKPRDILMDDNSRHFVYQIQYTSAVMYSIPIRYVPCNLNSLQFRRLNSWTILFHKFLVLFPRSLIFF